MHHPLQFQVDCELDLQVRGKSRLEKVKLSQGEVIEAEVRPYVEETDDGPVEFADLQLGEDGILRAVRMEYFAFV